MPEQALRELFGPGPAIVARAPGRVNLIGDHTDYNSGLVFPMAINRDLRIACRPVEGSRMEFISLDLNQRHAFDLGKLARDPVAERATAPKWAHYVMGVAYVLQQEGHALRAVQATIKGEVPIGAGLSSSAALEVAMAMAMCAVSELYINRERLALLCQRAENEFVGVNCGVMDQFASLLCRKDHALLLDCAKLEYDMIPLDGDAVQVVVCDSGVKRDLVNSPYNTRRKECSAAFGILKQHMPRITSYHDISMDALVAREHLLPEPLNRRARHVVTESLRVAHAVQALRRGDIVAFGALMDASHDSLKDDFEVSCAELDMLVDLARSRGGACGSRLTGAGFGGCTVSLVRPEAVDKFKETVAGGYLEATGRTPDIYIFRPQEGATVKTA